MHYTANKNLPFSLRSLWVLSRPIPLLAWSGCSILLGTATSAIVLSPIKILQLFFILLAAWLLQGLLAHAANDTEDWLSGTDAASQGILSGGSGVLKMKLLTLNTLEVVEHVAIYSAVIISLYFIWLRGPTVIILVFLGLWACLSYSRPPFRLAYHPFLGELLCAFPAVLAITVGTNYLLTGTIEEITFALGILHGLFSIGWLMIHHLADIPSDLAATPCKLTTPAWLYKIFGPVFVKLAPAFYFTLAILWAAFAAVFFTKLFLWSIPFGLLSLLITVYIRLDDVRSITFSELIIIFLVIVQSIILACIIKI